MHRDVMAFDISQDPVVRRWFAAQIVFRLQSIDGNYHLQVLKVCPFPRNWPEGAGDYLHVSALGQFRQQNIEFAITN